MTQTTPCPSCGAAAAGRFCAECGVALNAECRDCGTPLLPGARFCNECGRPVAAGTEPVAPARSSSLPWIITGAALVALIAVLLVPKLREPEPAAAAALSSSSQPAAPQGPFAGGQGGPAGDARSVDISSMSPRERADRLFNRVMQNVSTGDTTQARNFLPMAIAAYGMVPDLDADGHYHLAILQLVAGDGKEARAESDSILAKDPKHLFGLFTAAQAEAAMGNASVAKTFYKRFVDLYPSEMARGLPEYKEHAQALPPMKEAAEKALTQ
ncbi:MAG TPA: zinc ribbon domain-containing protein [Longimicrobiaceae bacterium]|jgi:hypothetical protein|nr:zinc ribbon domain-containing protein [Longimicrobiaceae bacterium]